MSQRLGDGGVVINLESDKMFELNGSAARIWELLCEGSDREALLGQLVDEFEGCPDTLAAEAFALIEDLLREGLLTERE